ncbi:hypothetical protein MXB_970 [Myxobolus squamalis]|nr:hypothetical protein MXB_970 [Myxobolus squamalis]
MFIKFAVSTVVVSSTSMYRKSMRTISTNTYVETLKCNFEKIVSYFSFSLSTAQCKQNFNQLPMYDLMVYVGGVGKNEVHDGITKTYSTKDQTKDSCLELFGEDAAFVILSPNYSFFGVADGVGGYNNYDIDPSIFSYTLMKFCMLETRKIIDDKLHPDCKTIMNNSYQNLIKLTDAAYGGSTITLTYFNHNDGQFNVSNLGDSKVMVIKSSEQQIFATREQQHYFNCPYQLANMPPNTARRCSGDRPSDAQHFSLKLALGDIILIGTDESD